MKLLNDLLKSDHQFTKAPSAQYQKIGNLFVELKVRWPLIVGDHLEKESIPYKIGKNSVIIATLGPVLAQELNFLETDILKKIHQSLGHEAQVWSCLSFTSVSQSQWDYLTKHLTKNQSISSDSMNAMTQDSTAQAQPLSSQEIKINEELQRMTLSLEKDY